MVPVRFSRPILSAVSDFIFLGDTNNAHAINIFLFVGLCARFAAGYGVREYLSRKRHRRAREQPGY